MIALLHIVSRLFNALPTRWLLFMGDALGWLTYYCLPFRRQVILENLEKAFGDQINGQGLENLVRENYFHYGRTFVEFLRSFCWTAEEYRRNTVVEGFEHIAPYIKSGKGGFFLTGHLGNWEVLIGSGAAAGIPLDIVVKNSRNSLLEKVLQRYRRKMGVGIFWETGTAKDILRSLSKGRFVGFILDQFMGPPIGLPVQFFGRKAGTTVSLALLTEKKDVPIFPAYSYRDHRGLLHTVICPPLEFPALSEARNDRLFEKTQYFNHILEEKIRFHPSQWLWLHRRWKNYNGVPRWIPKAFALGAGCLMLLLCACASKRTKETPTGIELPPDPVISVPTFEQTDKPETSLPVTPSAGDPARPQESNGLSEKHPKLEKKGKKGVGGKSKTLVVSPAPQKGEVFQVVPVDRIPFEVGERLDVSLEWMALPAGSAYMEVRSGAPLNGRPTFTLFGNVLSSKLVDAIYHVDNTAESFVDAQGIIPYKFLLHMVETHQLKETRVSFDHPQKKAFYWAKRISKRWGDQNLDRVDELIPRARDMWSGLYYARTFNYQLNKKESFYIYENGQNWLVELLPLGNELVASKVGYFQCWKILITVKLNNVLRPTGDIYVWLSDDSKRYIVKFDAKIKIGSLYGYLVGIREKL
ncbi:MAG: DUF3108 domain-containing protein [Deltaproteobacteria bacterium]|nr:DUF3108 domain-containing protein [Deltaproteobacteria bacterium]